MAADLRKVYTAATVDEAELTLAEFAEIWDEKFPTSSQFWRKYWENIIPFFDYSADIRKAIYTKNAIGSINMTLIKIIKKNKRLLPTDDSVFKVIYLAINNIEKK